MDTRRQCYPRHIVGRGGPEGLVHDDLECRERALDAVVELVRHERPVLLCSLALDGVVRHVRHSERRSASAR